MFRLQSNRPCRYDVFDDHPLVLHHNPIHRQLYHLVLHLERRFCSSPPDAGTKGLDTFEQPQFCGPICPLVLDLAHPLLQDAPMVFDPSAPLCQFSQLDHLSLIGVNQPRHFPVEGGELPIEAHPFLFGPDIHRRIATPLLILHPQYGGVGQQRDPA